MSTRGILKELPMATQRTGWPWTEETNPNTYSSGLDWPKISIVTPSYNQGEFIEETIRSVVLQNYPNLEYYIIDGGSTDGTIEIIKQYDRWITGWISEPDEGQGQAINKGLDHCTGEIFNWLNSDDYYAPGAFAIIADNFVQKDLNILTGICNIYDHYTNETISLHKLGIQKTPEETIADPSMNQPGTFFKLSVVKELNGINPSMRYMMDLELWIKYLCKYGLQKVASIDATLTHFRVHQSSKTAITNSVFEKEDEAIFYHLAKQMNFPTYLLKTIRLEMEEGANRFETFNLAGIDQKLMFKLYSHRYFIKLIESGRYSLSLFLGFFFNPANPTKQIGRTAQLKYAIKAFLSLVGILGIFDSSNRVIQSSE